MGSKVPPLPPDFGVGDNCLACWSTGKTPNYVFIRFWDISPCPGEAPPPNGYPFICKQFEHDACQFDGTLEFGGKTWIVFFHALYGQLYLYLDEPGYPYYFYADGDACALDFVNQLDPCPNFAGEGGRAHITIYTDPILIALTTSYGFCTVPGILYDSFDVTSPNAVYHIAHTGDKTNVLFLIDKDEF